MAYGTVEEPQPETPEASPRAAPRRAALVASLLCAGAAVAALTRSRPSASAARGALARLAADYDDYEFPDANDDYLYPQDDEFDDMGIDTYESDDQADISCEKIAYAIDGPHACTNITYDNTTCILVAYCDYVGGGYKVKNTCDISCCDIDETYELPGNYTVYDDTDGTLTCRSSGNACVQGDVDDPPVGQASPGLCSPTAAPTAPADRGSSPSGGGSTDDQAISPAGNNHDDDSTSSGDGFGSKAKATKARRAAKGSEKKGALAKRATEGVLSGDA